MRVCRLFVVALALVLLPLSAGAQEKRQQTCLGDGFKEARWGMTTDELKKVIPGLREDFSRYEPHVTAFHSFEFPNNGFSEFRLLDGKLFYIRVKITSPEFNDQLRQSMLRCGDPKLQDQSASAQRYLWADNVTSKVLYLYPYFAEIRAKSVPMGKEWAALKEEENQIDDFLNKRLSNASGDAPASSSPSSHGSTDAQLEALEKALEAERRNSIVPNE